MDISGKVVKKYVLNPAETKLLISENFAEGIYFYRILMDESVLLIDKLVIIK